MYKHQGTSNTDRIVREAERKIITSLSRTSAWKLEQKGLFPKRRRLNPEGSSCGWLLSEILEWCHSREVVNSVNM
jgi:prophage regulatory protein